MRRFEHAALIGVDVQKAIDADYHAAHGSRNNMDAESKIARLLRRWREECRALVHIRHDSTFPESACRPGQAGNDFKDEVARLPGGNGDPQANELSLSNSPNLLQPMSKVKNLESYFTKFDTTWSPLIVGELNGQHVKLAKLDGHKCPWHAHAREDEMFLVIEGRLEIQLRDRSLALGPNDFFIVPHRSSTG